MIHGGDIYTEGVLKGRELIDFSSNINPLGVPKSFRKAVDEALTDIVNYPDIKYRRIKEALSKYEGIPRENFVLGNGAAEIIDLSVRGINKVLLMAPAFAEYEISAKKWGCDIEFFHMDEVKNGDGTFSLKLNYSKLLDRLKDVDGLVVANPNNPDGSMIDIVEFTPILDFCQRNEKKVIIDEAFIHFTLVSDGSFVPLSKKYSCLLVIKALTKYYGMPGIRFGYGISSNGKWLDDMRDKQLPWNINTFAEKGVEAVLFDCEYDMASREWIENTRDGFIESLKEIDVFEKVYRSYGNYVLCKLKDISAKEFCMRCLENDFLIRNGDNYRNLSKMHIRLAVKDGERNRRLLEMIHGEFLK